MRRTAGELRGSRDTVSTLERVSMGGRSPGETEIRQQESGEKGVLQSRG